MTQATTCACGCGQPTALITKNDKGKGRVKGQRNKYVKGHTGNAVKAMLNLRRRPYQSVYTRLKYAASLRSLAMELSYEEFLCFTAKPVCVYCGACVQWQARRSRFGQSGGFAHNLDRKDNTLGYSKENCVVCCALCNMTKGNRYTYEEFILIGMVIKQIRGRRDERENQSVDRRSLQPYAAYSASEQQGGFFIPKPRVGDRNTSLGHSVCLC